MSKPKSPRGASPRLIAEFQLIVRRYAKAEEPVIELPTDFLVQIAHALDYVQRPGRPPKTRPQKLGESMSLSRARVRVLELMDEGYTRNEALDRVAMDFKRTNENFKKLAVSTIKDRLQRRKSKRPSSKSAAGK